MMLVNVALPASGRDRVVRGANVVHHAAEVGSHVPDVVRQFDQVAIHVANVAHHVGEVVIHVVDIVHHVSEVVIVLAPSCTKSSTW